MLPDEKESLRGVPDLPPSPFVAGTQVQYAWDSTCITTILECPQRYKYRIIDGWATKNPNTAVALVFGILFHYGIEQWHRAKARGEDYHTSCDSAIRSTLTKTEHGRVLVDQLPTDEDIQQQRTEEDEDDGISLRNSKIRTRYHLLRALVWYFENYRHDTLEVFHLATGEPAVELSFRVPVGIELSNGTELLLSGHMDRVVRFNDQLFVADVKTTKSISRQWAAGFDLSHQMTGYIIGGNIALGEPVAGAIIDGAALQIGGAKFGRHFTYRTKSQMAEYMRLLQHVAGQAEQYADDGFYPLNTSACMFCEFKDVCRQPPEQRDRTLDYLFERKEAWNPLKNR